MSGEGSKDSLQKSEKIKRPAGIRRDVYGGRILLSEEKRLEAGKEMC